jgi:hypothetical protein
MFKSPTAYDYVQKPNEIGLCSKARGKISMLGSKEAFLWGWTQSRNEKAHIAPRLNLTRGTPRPLQYPHRAHLGSWLGSCLGLSVSVCDIIGGASIGSVCLRALQGKFGGLFWGRALVSWLAINKKAPRRGSQGAGESFVNNCKNTVAPIELHFGACYVDPRQKQPTQPDST